MAFSPVWLFHLYGFFTCMALRMGFAYEFSSVWVFLCMGFPLYGFSSVWVFLCMGFPLYGFSSVWVLRMDFHLYEFCV